VIVDFEDSQDLIALSRGLTFAQIRISQSADGALISIPITGLSRSLRKSGKAISLRGCWT
jgi:hypothetical protein